MSSDRNSKLSNRSHPYNREPANDSVYVPPKTQPKPEPTVPSTQTKSQPTTYVYPYAGHPQSHSQASASNLQSYGTSQQTQPSQAGGGYQQGAHGTAYQGAEAQTRANQQS